MKMKLKMDQFLGGFLVFIALCFVFIYFFPIDIVEKTVSCFIILFILLSLPALQGTLRIITYSLLLIGMMLFLSVKAPIDDWLDGVRLNLTLVSIFTFVPLLGIPIRLGGYLESLKLLFERLNPKSSFIFLITQTLTHVLAVVLNIGSISIVHYLSKAAPIQSPRLLVSAVNRGFVTVIFWSPYFAAMAVMLSMLSITWGAILPYSLGFVLISFVVSLWIEWAFIKKVDVDFEVEVSATTEAEKTIDGGAFQKKIIELFLLLLFMMVTVLAIEFFSTLSMVIIICLVALIFPLLWSFLYKKQSGYRKELNNHIFVALPRMKKEVVLFFISGFFSAAFVHTHFSSTIINGMHALFGGFTIGIAYCIVFTIVTTAVFGLHPIVPITIFAASFEPQLLGFSSEYFAILLLGGWGISNALSPATASNNLLANLWEIDVTNASLRWNLKFGIILAIILPLYLEVVHI